MTEVETAPHGPRRTGRDVALVLISVGLLLFARHHDGPGAAFLREHGANVSFSFGAFYLLRLAHVPPSGRAWITALVALACVWLQELLQALGIYPGTFDAMDIVYDACGVGAAWLVHVFTARVGAPSVKR